MKEPIRLRDAAPPDDTVVIVRAGLRGLSDETLARVTSMSFDEYGFLGVSVYAAPSSFVAGLAVGREHLARYGSVQRTTAGELRTTGFPLLATQNDLAHYDVVLPDQHTRTYEWLRSCFGPPVPNPIRR